jgi:ribosome-binding factor A
MRRVDEAVRGVLSDAVRQLKDPRIGFLTVTDVDTSPDLSHATVYVSVLGTESERKGTLAGLRSAHGVLQRRVAKDLRMKRTPQLTFAYDDTHEKALELGRLIDREVGGSS